MSSDKSSKGEQGSPQQIFDDSIAEIVADLEKQPQSQEAPIEQAQNYSDGDSFDSNSNSNSNSLHASQSFVSFTNQKELIRDQFKQDLEDHFQSHRIQNTAKWIRIFETKFMMTNMGEVHEFSQGHFEVIKQDIESLSEEHAFKKMIKAQLPNNDGGGDILDDQEGEQINSYANQVDKGSRGTSKVIDSRPLEIMSEGAIQRGVLIDPKDIRQCLQQRKKLVKIKKDAALYPEMPFLPHCKKQVQTKSKNFNTLLVQFLLRKCSSSLQSDSDFETKGDYLGYMVDS